jgi:hypothetical protein
MPKNFIQNKKNEKKLKATSLDDYFLDKDLDIGFIKIDIDGYDLDVIEGSSQIIKRYHPIILTELNSGETERLSKLAQKYEYVIFSFIKYKNKIKFQLIESFDDSIQFKMLLLVPRNLENYYKLEC